MRAGPVALAVAVFAALACTGPQPVPVAPGTPDDTAPVLVGPGKRRKAGKAAKGKAGKGKAGKRKAGKGKAGPGRGGDPDARDPGEGGGGGGDGGGGEGPPAGLAYLGDDTWRVERSLVRRWVDEPSRLGCDAVDRPGGYEVRGVAEGEDAWYLGVRSGDLLRTANGRPLSDPGELLRLWGELDTADTVVVGLERGGDPRKFTYRLAD